MLFNTGAYEDAAKAYSNSENIGKSEKLLQLRSRCNIILKELNLALGDLGKLIDLKTANTMNYLIDRECLLSLKISSTVDNESETLNPEHLIEGIQRLAKMISYKSNGDVFKLHDLYFYKAVYHFYLQEYEQALDDLDSAYHYKEKFSRKGKGGSKKSSVDLQDMIKVLEDFCSERGEEEPEKGSFSSKEYIYNKSVILIMLGKFDKAIELLTILNQSIDNPESKEKVEFMIDMIYQEQSTRSKFGQHSIKTLDKSQDQTTENNTEEGKAFEIVIFDYYNRLCSIFPSMRLPFTSTKVVYEARLSFCLPTIDPPSLAPQINEDVIRDITVTNSITSLKI